MLKIKRDETNLERYGVTSYSKYQMNIKKEL
jgi:hypothetical protein